MDHKDEPDDVVDPLGGEEVTKEVKDPVEEIFDDDEEEVPKKKKKKHKDELDEIYEQGLGASDEDIYATEDFERYDDGISG